MIAEGVETQAQCDFLAGLGCHAYQGYLFGRALSLAEFDALGATKALNSKLALLTDTQS
ncbi:MAG: EAL domain-containing protein [Comamonadaceae bacterium]